MGSEDWKIKLRGRSHERFAEPLVRQLCKVLILERSFQKDNGFKSGAKGAVDSPYNEGISVFERLLGGFQSGSVFGRGFNPVINEYSQHPE